MVEIEREHHLLGDFTRTVEGTLLSEARLSTDVLDAQKAQAETEEDERYWDLALRNLFTRLALFGQAATGLMIHTVHRGKILTQRCHTFHWPPGAPNGSPAVRAVDLTLETPDIPSPWLDGSGLETLTPRMVQDWLEAQPGIEAAVAIPLIIGVGRRRRTQGFLAFGWDRHDHPGLKRYEAHRVVRDLVLQSLSIKLMATAQRAFVGRFFSMVAHNLRNPAFVLRSGLGLLRQGHYASAPFDDLREKYNELYRHAVHMDGIVDSILQFRQHHLEPKLKPVAIAHLVRDVVKACRKELEGRRLTLTYENWRPHSELQVVTDQTWIYEIVQNLLHNAMKYSPKGGAVDVVLTPRPAQRRVEITITDQGPGVAPEERAHIFEMFYRTRAAEESGTQGLGLGLYISRAYTDALGPEARLTVGDNPAGQGSVFTLFVPDLRH
jgi:signal transduction histidine kinase